VFVNIGLDNYAALKYTLGIRNIIKFGEKISCMSSEDIKSMQITEEASRLDPITAKIKIGQEAEIREGFFKGNLVKICSLASKKRVDVLIKFLGSSRKISIHEANLTL
jgi:transcription antitermination factor NusG